jgi:hypothetical protein
MDVHGIMISVNYVLINSKISTWPAPLPRADPRNLKFLKFDLSNSPPPMQQMSSNAPL